MDKLVTRTIKAERQVARRLGDAAKRAHRLEYRERIRRAKNAIEDLNRNVAESRRVRHERWEMGPLAPKRAIEQGHGIAAEMTRSGKQVANFLMRPHEREARCEWAGGSRFLNLVAGDRVVVLEGHDKGSIDTIASVNPAAGTVELNELAKLVARSPEWLIGKSVDNGQTYPNHSTVHMAVPISAVRLVHPITDPATGITRDVIIRKLAHANVRRDRLTKTTEWDRYVPGLNTIIPWPEKKDPEEVETKADTSRSDVQEATFVPTLLRPPMPEALVHELRNRYSRFRTRHESWYLEKKAAEANAEKDAKKGVETMLTPQDEFNRQRKEERRALGQPVLTTEMLERLGAHMAKNKAKTA